MGWYRQVWVSRGNYEALRDLSIARGVSKSAKNAQKRPPISETLEDLLEIAYRCIETHGVDFTILAGPKTSAYREAVTAKVRQRIPNNRRKTPRNSKGRYVRLPARRIK